MSTERLRTGLLGWCGLALLLAALGGCEAVVPKRSAGEKLYRKHCAECHGLDGAGQTIWSMGDNEANLLDDAWRYGGGGASGIRTVIGQDLVFDHPTFSARLSPEQIKEIANHVMALRAED